MLELRDVSFTYDRVVLNGISLEIRDGEILALLGPNGAGKSTLLSVSHGALKPSEGEVFFDGQPIAKFSRRELAQRMALVAQAGELRFPLTVLEFVLTGRFAHTAVLGFDSPRDVEIAIRSLEETDAAQFSDRPFNDLSSGERQRVVLARALAQEPRLLLLDEPTANADIAHQLSLLSFVRELARKKKIGALIVTHEINLAAEFADRVALLKNGVLIACGEPKLVMTDNLLGQLFDTALIVDRHPQSGNPRVSWVITT